MTTLGLAGDTMLGRYVAERLRADPPQSLFSEALVALAHEADLLVLNLECAVSERGQRWPDPAKPFFFRAPPSAVEALALLGVDCVTLANNHALDYGPEALLDTFEHLAAAGIARVGAGHDVASARAPGVLEHHGFRLGVLGLTDHPAAFAATASNPGVAYYRMDDEPEPWTVEAIGALEADAVLVSPHWGPNMVGEPVPRVRRAAARFGDAGATLVAGHSAHVFHGVADATIFDLGDFVDDYAVHPTLRNDLGLFFLVEFRDHRPVRLEAVPLALDYCHTRLADDDEAAWVRNRFWDACAAFGTHVTEEHGRLVVDQGWC